MKITAYRSSPHPSGDSNSCLERLINRIRERSSKISVGCDLKSVNLFAKQIAKCNACNVCRETSVDYCVIDDDMSPLYDEFIHSDVVIFASPIHWWGMSCALKGFVDRLYALNCEQHPDRFAKKKVLMLLCYAGENEKESGALLVKSTFEDMCEYTGMEFVGLIGVCTARNQMDLQKLDNDIDTALKQIF